MEEKIKSKYLWMFIYNEYKSISNPCTWHAMLQIWNRADARLFMHTIDSYIPICTYNVDIAGFCQITANACVTFTVPM